VYAPSSLLQQPELLSVLKQPLQHDCKDAILHACNVMAKTDKEKTKTLALVEAMDLMPFALLDADGNEHNALAHTTVIEDLISRSPTISPILPTKRAFFDIDQDVNMACSNCSPPPPTFLCSVLSTSPYRRLLNTRSFIELTNDHCEPLNYDWSLHPHMKHVAAQLLAGCIL
ncbi:hypothetical protein DM01DRAFT_1269563, partial [Hesseltinella vesiculosa]